MAIPSHISDQLVSLARSVSNTEKATDFPFGFGQIGVHECIAHEFGDMTAITGFALTNVKSEGAVLWVRQYRIAQEHGTILKSGSAAFQHIKSHCLHVKTSKRMDALWAIEEGIKSGTVSLVIGEVDEADFTATRRLKLASERYGVPVVLLMPHTREGISACETQWRISTQPSALNPYDTKGVGKSRWQATLERCRLAPEHVGEVFDLEYDDETLSLCVVSRMGIGSLEKGKMSKITREAVPFRKTA
ncbi:ImuA family protein [Hirschia maritima]|uniref:ImuA family protein n=1 Tax=Hirschia maritima TaxID=1121961 RepID=UPI0003A10AE5|nr:hypothetical protein [Hirschia maritima]